MKQNEGPANFQLPDEDSEEYRKALEEDVAIILAGEKAGRWKTLEEIEEERKRRREAI